LITDLEEKLDSFNAAQRREALEALAALARQGKIELPPPGREVNMHCHTFFSYNSYGYSPSKFAWLARRRGLALAGIVDFDVLDGLEEFLPAGRLLGLKVCGGIETRVFVPEFADKEMTSPGEPGITYHMGVGFPTAKLSDSQEKFQKSLKDTAQQRNRELMERVNEYLAPVKLNYEQDVLVLTPAGNPTERHLCVAYAHKASQLFKNRQMLAEFWTQKLKEQIEDADLPEGRDFLNLLRAKTMKRGGVGYVQPEAGAFVKLANMNQFVLNAGGIPTHTWLNGFSAGEKEMEKFLQVTMSTGVAALNIIPDRNYTADLKDDKLKNLYAVVELARKLNLPIVAGTEMNSPQQKFVDDFGTKELTPLRDIFLQGAHIVYAHSVLQRQGDLGYCSNWAQENFSNTAKKNAFFEELGQLHKADRENVWREWGKDMEPAQILDKVKGQQG